MIIYPKGKRFSNKVLFRFEYGTRYWDGETVWNLRFFKLENIKLFQADRERRAEQGKK